MGIRAIKEYTCDLCGDRIVLDIKPEGWKVLEFSLIDEKCVCSECNKLLKEANSSAGY